jgi:hypothetical protein
MWEVIENIYPIMLECCSYAKALKAARGKIKNISQKMIQVIPVRLTASETGYTLVMFD